MKAFNELVNEMNGVDIVIINSGVGKGGETLLWENERPVIDVNVTGFTAMAVAVTDYFVKQKKGHIVGISSIAAIRAHGECPAYCASKSFVSAYLSGLKHKFAHQGFKDIYVTDIQPGYVKTPMMEGEKMFWAATPEKAAAQIYNAVMKRKKIAYITKRWVLMTWFIRLCPDFIWSRI
ncbi:MAG: SDR family NAD(P)-dependent oxidoreductase [Pseudomonadota bacterium]